jgi:hypothetical protein
MKNTNLFKTFQPFINKCGKISMPICGYVKVESGTAFITDLETFVQFPTELPDGMYKVINGETFRSSAYPDEFPVLELGNKNAHGFLNGDDIVSLASCVSDDELRPVMQGIHLTNENLAASDAHVLRWFKIEPGDTKGFFNDIFTPSIPLLSRIKADDPKAIIEVTTFFDLKAFRQNEKGDKKPIVQHIAFSFSDCTITQRVVDGHYPNWTGIIPSVSRMQAAMVISNQTLTDMVKTVKAFKGSGLVRVTPQKMIKENIDLELYKDWPVQFCEVPYRDPDALCMPMMIEGDGILGFNPEVLNRARTLHNGNIIIGWEPDTSGSVSRPMLVWLEKPNDSIHLLSEYSLPVPNPIPDVPEVPETQEPEVPETQEPEVPETQEPEVPETQEPEVPETQEPVTHQIIKPSNQPITILSYTDRSIIVVGPTKPFKEAFKAAWGRWSVNLKHPETGKPVKGWVFSNKRRSQVEQILAA